MVSVAAMNGIVNLHGKRVLVTQSREFMGPVLCEVLAEAGAEVIADDSSLDDPQAPAALLARAQPWTAQLLLMCAGHPVRGEPWAAWHRGASGGLAPACA